MSRTSSRFSVKSLIAVSVIVLAAVVVAPPLMRTFTDYRSKSLLNDSRDRASKNEWKSAVQRAEAARQLRPDSLEVMRQLFGLYRGLRDPAAVEMGKAICQHRDSTSQEKAEVLSLLLVNGELRAFAIIYDDLDADTKSDRRIRWAYARWLSAMADYGRAEQELESLLAESSEPDVQMSLAQLLLAISDPDAKSRALELLSELMAADDRTVALNAARLVGKLRPADVTPELSRAVSDCIQDHEASTVDDKLFAHTLEIRVNRDRREEIIERAVSELGDTEMLSVARWLNSIGESKRALALVPHEHAASNVELYELYFTALMAEGEWAAADGWLESPPPSLDPVRLSTFKASVALKRNDPKSATRHWTLALNQAAWDKSSNHYQRIYQMAAVAGAEEIAMEALLGWYKSHSVQVPDLSHAERLLTWLSRGGRDRDMITVLEQLERRGAKHPSITNTLAYFQILYGQDVQGAVTALRELVEAFPDRTDYRTSLALGLLELDRPHEALNELSRDPVIDWQSASDSGRVLYGRALAANDRTHEAVEILKTVDRAKLLPKERQFFDTDLKRPSVEAILAP